MPSENSVPKSKNRDKQIKIKSKIPQQNASDSTQSDEEGEQIVKKRKGFRSFVKSVCKKALRQQQKGYNQLPQNE